MKNFLNNRSRQTGLALLFFAATVLPLKADPQASTTVPKTYPKTYFLDIASLQINEVLPNPPSNNWAMHQDLFYLKDALATRTKRQIARAKTASTDDPFDYSQALGPDFNITNLPLTAALFKKVTSDAKVAITAAKEDFQRRRPLTWKSKTGPAEQAGYSYPSGHTTRAFLWAALLTNLFPEKHKEIKQEARQKAWNRVILGRHYPDDVYGGEIYGRYLAKQFLKNPQFREEWNLVKQEAKSFNKANKQ